MTWVDQQPGSDDRLLTRPHLRGNTADRFDSFWRLATPHRTLRHDTEHQATAPLVDDDSLKPLGPPGKTANHYLWLSDEEKRRGRDTLLRPA